MKVFLSAEKLREKSEARFNIRPQRGNLRDSRTDAPIKNLTAAIRSIRPFCNMGLFRI
jgi:hypothetical protein